MNNSRCFTESNIDKIDFKLVSLWPKCFLEQSMCRMLRKIKKKCFLLKNTIHRSIDFVILFCIYEKKLFAQELRLMQYFRFCTVCRRPEEYWNPHFASINDYNYNKCIQNANAHTKYSRWIPHNFVILFFW